MGWCGVGRREPVYRRRRSPARANHRGSGVIAVTGSCTSHCPGGRRAVETEVPPGFEPGNEGFADPCLTTWPRRLMERKTGFEPATTGLGSQRSTPELLPPAVILYLDFFFSQISICFKTFIQLVYILKEINLKY